MEAYDTFEHDVLVIGAGGAGLRAAIAAAEAGLNVGVVCKSLLGKAHTVMAEGGIAGRAGEPGQEGLLAGPLHGHHAGGQFLNNWRTVRDPGARKRRSACWSWSSGARCSTARPKG